MEQLPWQKHSVSWAEQQSCWRLHARKKRKCEPRPCRITGWKRLTRPLNPGLHKGKPYCREDSRRTSVRWIYHGSPHLHIVRGTAGWREAKFGEKSEGRLCQFIHVVVWLSLTHLLSKHGLPFGYIALIEAIAKHNPSNSRYCREKCCPPKVSLNNHKLVVAVLIVLITRAKPIFQHILCDTWLFFHWTSTGRFLRRALRNTWAGAEPPASNHLLRGHLSRHTEVLGIMCSCRELRGKDFSLPPSHHESCPAQLLHYRVMLRAQKPFSLPSQICPAPCRITLPADLSRREESSSHPCCVPGCMDLYSHLSAIHVWVSHMDYTQL